MVTKTKSEVEAYPALEVAKYFIYLGTQEPGDDEGKSPAGISHLKLQKLLYFAQAYYLVFCGGPLFSDEVEAWDYGPVVRSVWDEYKGKKAEPLVFEGDASLISLGPYDQEKILQGVWEIFGIYSAGALVDMVHSHTPWVEAYKSSSSKKVIPQKTIKEYYKPRLRS